MSNIVPETPKKGNTRLKTVLLVLLIVLVGVASFGLGRLSVREPAEGSLIIHEAPQESR